MASGKCAQERAALLESWKPFAGAGPGRRGDRAAGEGRGAWGKQRRLPPEARDGVSADKPAARGAARIGESRAAGAGECCDSLPIGEVLQENAPDGQGQDRVSTDGGAAKPGGEIPTVGTVKGRLAGSGR